MYKKRLLSIALAAAMTFGVMTACGDNNNNTNQTTSEAGVDNSEAVSPTEESSKSNDSSSEAATEASASEEVPSVTVKGITERSDEMRDISAKELVAEMTAGWNLGNTLEATGGNGIDSETSWGNPKITKEMIDFVCEKGFDSIRIPITWGNHVSEAPDYTIDPEWMDRIEEVVNYALDDGMYVLIDSHHEEFWRIPDAEHIEAVDAENIAIWNQIAERFKDYGDHLVFEGLNEPRTKGSENEWSGGTHEERVLVNRLNKSFVDTVRATGGNNEKRLLLVTTYAGANMPEVLNELDVPEDDEHIGVAIHAYEPYLFTFSGGDGEYATWDGSHNGDIIKLMTRLETTFIKNDIPVLLTEYGAMNKKENTEEVVKWAEAYVSRATERGIPCFWWDNGIYTQQGEKFAILDRKNLKWYREEVVDTVIRESYNGKN
ncbi:glycoside hydrolase family 5 protein [Butyrivibrio sp. VCB2006]|uniref:glycoside hydrolase family 5 protein n=1 Tax=Butyrivibrio sp. VCB2006 TaxID=1280679 RepID=UPI0003FF7ACA|nr:glycoside hydrolase family 5 protein [Butyrivibrio sp. VCB2006]